MLLLVKTALTVLFALCVFALWEGVMYKLLEILIHQSCIRNLPQKHSPLQLTLKFILETTDGETEGWAGV